jgi:hypothetical protein
MSHVNAHFGKMANLVTDDSDIGHKSAIDDKRGMERRNSDQPEWHLLMHAGLTCNGGVYI